MAPPTRPIDGVRNAQHHREPTLTPYPPLPPTAPAARRARAEETVAAVVRALQERTLAPIPVIITGRDGGRDQRVMAQTTLTLTRETPPRLLATLTLPGDGVSREARSDYRTALNNQTRRYVEDLLRGAGLDRAYFAGTSVVWT